MPSSFNASLNVQLNAASLNASTKQISNALGRITGQASEFQKSLDASTARVFAFGATTLVLNGVTQAFKKLVATTVEVEKRLVEINSIFQATESTFNRFRNSIFQVAKETGQAFSTVAEGAAELARQGLSAEETATRLKAALVLTRISGLDAEKSVKSLTAAINGFASAGLTANQIVNKMVAVDTAFAVSAQDLADGFSRAGSTAEDAGVSFNELLALITAVEQRTARGGAVIGNAFKSIFTRLQRGTTIDKLQELGVAIDATQTGVQKLQALSNAIEGMSDPTIISQVKELAGGVFQINVVSAALKDLSNETGIFAEAAKVAASATNEAFQKNEALNKTIASQMNALVVGLTSLAERIGTISFGPLLESLVGIASKITGFLDKALDPEKGNSLIKGFFKGIGMFLSGPMVILVTAAFVKITKLVAKFAVEGMKALFAMGTQAEKIKQIEGGIVGLLGRDANLRNIITSATTTQAQKEQAVIVAIQRENALLKEQATIMRSLAVAAASRGVSGFGAGGFTGRRGRFAGGFRAEEAEARMLGAPAGVRAKSSSGTIGGRKFVMNNRETEIPRFGRNGDSAVIPHYARGFVPNYAAPRIPKQTAGTGAAGTFSPNLKRAGEMLAYAQDKNKAASQFFKSRGDEGEWDWASAWMKNAKNIKLKDAGGKMRSFPIKSALDKRKKQYLSKKTYFGNEDPRSVMLIPQSLDFGKNLADHKFIKPYKSTKNAVIDFFEGGMAGISSKMPNVSTKGGKKLSILANLDGLIEENLAAGANAAISKTKDAVGFDLDPEELGVEEFRETLEKGGKGAFGAIKGAVFEVIMSSVAGAVSQDKEGARGGQLDVDFKKDKNNILDDIFGVKGMQYGDFKSSGSTGNKTKYAKQIVDNVKGTVESAADKKPPKHKIKNTKRRAAGFIPNYAGGPVNSSQIRVHKDSLGDPLAVTNTRDEPRGLQDAIGREKKGIGMYAGGFVPNFMVNPQITSQNTGGGRGSGGSAALQASVGKTTTAFNKMQTSGMGVYMMYGVLQTSIGTIIASNDKRIATAQTLSDKEIEKIESSDKDFFTKKKLIRQEKDLIKAMKDQPPVYVRLAKAAQTAATALFAIAALNMATGGGLGKAVMGSKAGKGVKGFFGGGAAGKNAFTTARQGGASKAEALKAGKGARFGSKMMRGGGALAVAGGAFAIHNTLSNKDLNKREKSEGVGEAVGGTAGAIGGMMIGQAMIPIPIVGALIGAAVGGILVGQTGKEVGGLLSPEQKRLDINEATAQASFFAGKGDSVERRTVDEVGFDQHRDVLPPEWSESILKKMGADIQANIGNVPFEALESLAQDATGDIQDWVDAKKRYTKDFEDWENAGPSGSSGDIENERKIEAAHQKKLEMADRAILKYSDQLANARALQAGHHFKNDKEQEAWEGRMKAARSKLESATQKIARSTFELAQAQTKRIALATQQETAAKDQKFLVDALATGPNAMAAKTMAGINAQEASLELPRQAMKISEDTLSYAVEDAWNKTSSMVGGEGWEDKSMDEKQRASDARDLAVDKMIAPKAAMFDTTKKAFESAALKFGIGLKKVEIDINAQRYANQTKINNLLEKTVNNLTSHVKSMYERGGVDASMMEIQGSMMAELAKKAAAGTATEEEKQRLGQMTTEYDDQGLGISVDKILQFYEMSAEQVAKAMKAVGEAAITGDKEAFFGRERVGRDGRAISMRDEIATGKGYGTEEIDELKKQELALAGTMAVVTEKWKTFADKESDTGVTAKKIEDMQKAINKGGKNADAILEHLKKVLTASESQTTFIEAQARFAAQAIATIEAQTARLEGLEGEVKRIQGQGDVDYTVLGAM